MISAARWIRVGLLLLVSGVLANARADSYEDYRWAIEMDQVRSFKDVASRGLGHNLIMPNGSPALVYAMQLGSKSVTEWLLLQTDLDVNLIDAKGDSALMTASFLGEMAWVKSLLKRGAQINPNQGWTPLHYAASNGQVTVVQYLISQGANVNALSASETTALMMAARAGSTEVAIALIKAGAKVNLKNQSGFSAMSYAEKLDNLELKKILLKSYD
jgi:ankyrin repeat protein